MSVFPHIEHSDLDCTENICHAQVMENTTLKRVSNACRLCRVRKVKCDGSRPCGNCKDRGKDCRYLPRERRQPRTGNAVIYQDAMAPMESILHLDNNVAPIQDETASRPGPSPSQTTQLPLPPHSSSEFSQFGSPGRQHNWFQELPSSSSIHLNPPEPRSAKPDTELATEHDEGRRDLPTPESSVIDRAEIVISPESVVWEYHGPISWASICSGPGIRWVQEKANTKTFDNTAQRLILSWARRLKLPQGASRERCQEPDVKRAWSYTKAYFEKSYDRIFGIVYQPDFEARLQRHFETAFDHDPAWYALRNAVYAEGCRNVESGDTPRDFSMIQAEAARYFENAISVITDLLFTPNGIMAVQALAVMISYAEGLGSPALEYILCTNAVRVAQSKGLHCQPSKAWGLPESDVIQRNWLFWAIYCYEKYIVLRSGRPSILDDDNISCEIPETAVPGSTINPVVFRTVIKHAQICSIMSRKLSSVRTFRQSPKDLMETVRQLGSSLDAWWRSLTDYFENGPLNKTSPPFSQKNDTIRFCHMYYGSRIALHANFTYPWISVLLGGNGNKDFQDQLASSATIAAESAREILISTRHIDTNVSSPAWLVFYFPMLAVINLFIHILKYPNMSSGQSDLALLDIASGHFGHVKLLTGSEVDFTFPREIAILADNFLRRHMSAPADNFTPGEIAENTFNVQGEPEIQGNFDDLSTFMIGLSDTTDQDFATWNAMSTEVLDGFLGT